MLSRSLNRLLGSLMVPLVIAGFAACDGCNDNAACQEFGIECGKTCVDDFSCADGMYCSDDKTCSADCTPEGGQCGDDETCTKRGQCSGGEGGDGEGASSTGNFNNNGGGDEGGSGGGCPSVVVDFAPTTPTVILLVDQSGSMTESFGGGNRWDVLHDTLMDPTTGIVASLEDQVRFGLALYTGDGGANCPQLAQVSIALGNYAAMEAVYGANGPDGETPTGASIMGILPTLVAFNEPGPKVIVLATDGEPDTCAEPNPQNGQAEAIAAAQAAFGMGVGVSIIAVGGDVSITHQQDMANAGAGLPLDGSMGNATYYPADNQAALEDAFLEIINGVRSCVLTLDGTVDPAKADEGHVYLNGNELTFGDPDGWQLNSPTEIELLGAACDEIQEGDDVVTGEFECGAIGPPPE